ncbi:MAG: VOC family protein [Pseudomonadota bacterium]
MTEPRRFDHIVVVVHDLDRAAARYEAMGFTLTPRARHPDHMGTSNRLIQFADRTFIELLEIDRPESCAPHGPRFFSFGQHAQSFLTEGEGIAMMVYAGEDAPGDAGTFAAAGLGSFDPFDFGRKATLPDGREVEVGFSLAYALPPGLGRSGFFTCHNRFPENFWKPDFQVHANGATGMAEVCLAVDAPAETAVTVQVISGATAEQVEGGLVFPTGTGQRFLALTPATIAGMTGLTAPAAPGFAGVGITGMTGGIVAPTDACGLFLRPL